MGFIEGIVLLFIICTFLEVCVGLARCCDGMYTLFRLFVVFPIDNILNPPPNHKD